MNILRPYQSEALDFIHKEFYIKNNDSATLCIPTGAGKTFIFINQISRSNERFIFIGVPSLQLESQTINALEENFDLLMNMQNNGFISVTSISSSYGEIYKSDKIVVCKVKNEHLFIHLNEKVKNGRSFIVIYLYQSIKNLTDALQPMSLEIKEKLKFYSLGIYDEAHRLCTRKIEERNKILSGIIFKSYISKNLFVTATPIFLTESVKNRMMSSPEFEYVRKKYKVTDPILSLNDKAIFGTTFECQIQDLTERGFLCKYDVTVPYISINSLNNNDENIALAISIFIISDICKGRKERVVVYLKDIKTLIKFYSILNLTINENFDESEVKEILVEQIHSEISLQKRNFILNNEITNDKYKYCIFLTCQCINEGVNIPTLSTAILLRPCLLTHTLIQIVGRFLRNHDEKERARIVIPLFFSKIDQENLAKIGFNLKNNKEMVVSDLLALYRDDTIEMSCYKNKRIFKSFINGLLDLNRNVDSKVPFIKNHSILPREERKLRRNKRIEFVAESINELLKNKSKLFYKISKQDLIELCGDIKILLKLRSFEEKIEILKNFYKVNNRFPDKLLGHLEKSSNIYLDQNNVKESLAYDILKDFQNKKSLKSLKDFEEEALCRELPLIAISKTKIERNILKFARNYMKFDLKYNCTPSPNSMKPAEKSLGRELEYYVSGFENLTNREKQVVNFIFKSRELPKNIIKVPKERKDVMEGFSLFRKNKNFFLDNKASFPLKDDIEEHKSYRRLKFLLKNKELYDLCSDEDYDILVKIIDDSKMLSKIYN